MSEDKEDTQKADHQHCPKGCEHPQPIQDGDKAYCGRCWFVDHVMTEMVDCNPENC